MRKIWVGYEELWVIVLEGTHRGGKTVELPDDVAARCEAAQVEWDACGEILGEAYRKAGGQW